MSMQILYHVLILCQMNVLAIYIISENWNDTEPMYRIGITTHSYQFGNVVVMRYHIDLTFKLGGMFSALKVRPEISIF